MNKKAIIAGLATALLLCVVFVLLPKDTGTLKTTENPNKIKIVATLFPQYDFAKQIAKDRADVTLLVDPGVETHTYEPSPADIVKINASDIMIYTGKYMELWAEKIISSKTNENLLVVDASENIKLSKNEHEHEHEGKSGCCQDKHHDDDECCGEDSCECEHGHAHEFDPHIWTDPNNAIIMTDNILAAMCEKDKENAAFYKENAEALKQELAELDNELKNISKDGKHKEIVLGGRNAFYYFASRYGLDIEAAHNSCSTEGDPSAKKVAYLIDLVKKEHLPVVYYEELSIPKIARLISQETGAKILPLHSCHNLSKEDIERNTTYVSMMRENIKNLKEGLK